MVTSPYARTFNRYELKYLLGHEEMEGFVAELSGYVRDDPHADPERGYPVYSLYWDQSDFEFFWEKIDGQKYRRKLRFRRYTDSDQGFLEIKQRIDRTVQKRRVRMPLEAIHRLFDANARSQHDAHEPDDPVYSEAAFLHRYHALVPIIAVLYQRRAFFAVHESDLRITFDTRLRYDSRALDIRRPFEVGKTLLEPQLAVMEIKFNDRVPLWLTKLVRRHELHLVRYSKYCSAVDREFFAGRYT